MPLFDFQLKGIEKTIQNWFLYLNNERYYVKIR